ncbi:MAG: hypothetical protein E6J34_00725 [Chloroflexi bacterium]|nr:MAG: hypothetical protein E6J34_00725 [Chloroflexota bacterium]
MYGHLRIIARQRAAVTVFINEWRFLSPERQEIIKQCRDAYEACFQRVIEEGVKAGLWSVADTRLATLIMLGTLNWTYHWINLAGRLGIEQLAEKYFAVIMLSLKADVFEGEPLCEKCLATASSYRDHAQFVNIVMYVNR